MTTTELLPCPFCGAAARLIHDTGSDYERHWSWRAECTNFGECEASLTGFASAEAAVAKWNSRHAAPVLLAFYNEVCDQAERNMAATNTVSGAHWNAMRQVLKAKGIEVTR